ncbi:MAG: LacI family DNA-binding transcriptional regulator [Cyclobacteriaceae bacterium]
MKKGQITIKDIARKMNTSITTVSRALSNSPLVRQETKELIQAFANEHHYVPSYQGFSLRSSKTNTIGIILPKLVHEFFSKVIRGVEHYAQAHHYNVILCPSHDSYEREVSHVNRLINGRVDGLIACISNETQDFGHFESCVERGIPLVFFDCVCDGFTVPTVVLDDFNAGYHAVTHLIEQGCRRIAYLGGPNHVSVNKNRYNGYLKALSDAQLGMNSTWESHCPTDSYEIGSAHTNLLLDTNEIDGIFASTDVLAISAIKAIKARGLRVPEDIAVVGFSNWSIGSMYEPALTTMSQPGRKIGQKAAQSLIRQINDPEHQHHERIVIKSDLLIRESSVRVV